MPNKCDIGRSLLPTGLDLSMSTADVEDKYSKLVDSKFIESDMFYHFNLMSIYTASRCQANLRCTIMSCRKMYEKKMGPAGQLID